MSRKKFNHLDSISNFCKECKGSCWKGTDNAATQKAALEKFGIIPNLCVNSKDGIIRCPFPND